MRILAAGLASVLAGCAPTPAPESASSMAPIYEPAPGSNLVLEGPIAAAPGHHLVMGDLVAPAGAAIPAHTHSGEEFLYLLAGSVTLRRVGEPDLQLRAGEAVRIAPGVVHSGLAGPKGLRAISSWVVKNGEPLRKAAGE